MAINTFFNQSKRKITCHTNVMSNNCQPTKTALISLIAFQSLSYNIIINVSYILYMSNNQYFCIKKLKIVVLE